MPGCWSTWSSWSDCFDNTNCNGSLTSTMIRTRSCTPGIGIVNDVSCHGDDMESRECSGGDNFESCKHYFIDSRGSYWHLCVL